MKRPMFGLFLAMLLGNVVELGICVMHIKYSRISLLLRFLLAMAPIIGAWLSFKLSHNQRKTKKQKILVVGVLLIAYALGGLSGHYHCKNQVVATNYFARKSEGKESVTITGIVKSRKSLSYERIILKECKLRTKEGEKELSIPEVEVYYFSNAERNTESGDLNSVEPGSKVILRGIPEVLKPATNDGGYDEAYICFSKEICAKFQNPDMRVIQKSKGMKAFLERLKVRILKVYESNMDREEAQIMEGICLGCQDQIDKELRDAFAVAGMVHVLAVSGMHVSIVGLYLLKAFRKGKLSVSISIGVAALGALFFSLFTGAALATLRALSMFVIMLGGMWLGEDYDGLNSLGLAGMILCLFKPISFLQMGVQYSFLGVGSIFCGVEIIEMKKLRNRFRNSSFPHLEGHIKKIFLALWITFPLMILNAWYHYTIPTYSFLLNLVFLPCLPILLVLGLLGGVAGLVSLLISRPFLVLPEVLIKGMIWVVKRYEVIPGGTIIVGKPTPFMILFAIILLLVFFLGLRNYIFKVDNFGDKWIKFSKIVPLVFLLIAYLTLILLSNRNYKNKVSFLDVGQGDGICMESEDDTLIMIDGGSSTVEEVGERILKPYLLYHGRKKVDVWFVSHCDEDHIRGLRQLAMENFPIGVVVFSKNVVKNRQYEELRLILKKRRIPVRFVTDGERISTKELEIHFLVPRIDDKTLEFDANANCLVLDIQYRKSKKRIFLAGDIPTSVEEKLNRISGTHYEIYKAIHHGSKNSNSEDLLKKLSPKYCVISSGKGNRYGHPHMEALERIKKYAKIICRTDERGQVNFAM